MINVIASGSKGNCTAVTFGKVTILLDAGIGFDRIQRALNFKNPTAVFITHEHGDHAKLSTIQELLKRGVDVYMTKGTAEALKLKSSHRLHLIEVGVRYQMEDYINKSRYKFYATRTIHDAAEPVMYSFWDCHNVVRYIVDSGEIPLQIMPADYLLIEANFLETELQNADIDSTQKERIFKNHLSAEKVLKWLKKDLIITKPREIHLLHISKRHGNGEIFRQMVQAEVGDDVKVFAH